MHAQPHRQEKARAASSANSMGSRVLWAEDNVQDRTFIQEALDQAANPGVTLVPDGVALLQALGQSRPDLVVLDLKMPKLGGMEVLRQMRAHPEWNSLRVVVFSSGERPDEIAQCRALGVADVIVKPVDFDLFASEVQRIVGCATRDHESGGGTPQGHALADA